MLGEFRLPLFGSAYSWLLLAGIAATLLFWSRLARRDERLLIIYLAALASAFLGAKLVYMAAEGWMFQGDPQRWVIWATGKTILGALLGGYAGVEAAKKVLSYKAPTGDFFALVAPLGIILGRVGCLFHGCCLGQVCEPDWWTIADTAGIPGGLRCHLKLPSTPPRPLPSFFWEALAGQGRH